MTWKPITERDTPAPSQIPFDLTDSERSKAAVYSLDLERQRRARNKRDRMLLGINPRNEGPGAA